MNPVLVRLRPLVQPLSIAGLVTWIAIYATLLRESPALDGRVIGGALAFVAMFVAVLLDAGAHKRAALALAVAQALLALALCAVAPSTLVPVLMIVVMVQFAHLLPARALLAAAIALNVALYLVFLVYWTGAPAWLLTLIYGSFQAFAGLVAWYARRAEQAADELRQVNAHLLATRSLLEETARDQERLRLARELHDVAGHKLTALKLNLALAERANAERADVDRSVAIGARLAEELLHDIRAVVAQLRQHDGMDLRGALAELAVPWPRPRVHLDVGADARVADVAQAQAILRAVQEAITNAAKHSDAGNLWISLQRDGDRVVLSMHDDGRGVAALSVGHGLAGMRERIESLGGALDIASRPGDGFRLRASLPLTPA